MKAILAGTFDPFTTGHRDLTERAARIFDGVTVAVAADTGKCAAPLADRQAIASLSVSDMKNVTVVPFCGLLSEFVKKNAPCVLVRGVRGGADLEYERGLERVYKELCGVECVYLASAPELQHVSSTAVRQLASLGADISGYVDGKAKDKVKEIYFKA